MKPLIMDWDAWDRAHQPSSRLERATESLDALGERLCGDHCDLRHEGKGVRWNVDLAGIYCENCLDHAYYFNISCYDDFVRVIDGFVPETDFREIAFLPD